MSASSSRLDARSEAQNLHALLVLGNAERQSEGLCPIAWVVCERCSVPALQSPPAQQPLYHSKGHLQARCQRPSVPQPSRGAQLPAWAAAALAGTAEVAWQQAPMVGQAAAGPTQLVRLLRCPQLPDHNLRRCEWGPLLLLLPQRLSSRSSLSLPAAGIRQQGRLGLLGTLPPLQQCLQQLETTSQRMRQWLLAHNLSSPKRPSNRYGCCLGKSNHGISTTWVGFGRLSHAAPSRLANANS